MLKQSCHGYKRNNTLMKASFFDANDICIPAGKLHAGLNMAYHVFMINPFQVLITACVYHWYLNKRGEVDKKWKTEYLLELNEEDSNMTE